MFDDDLLQQMDPEELKQLLGLGTLDERDELLQQQMLQAQALGQPNRTQHSTALGAALGGLGNVAGAIGGGIGNAQSMAGREALLGQKDAGRNLYLDALRRRSPPGGASAGRSALQGFGAGPTDDELAAMGGGMGSGALFGF
jgi:hypothetical protein